ncbi:MAG: L-threonylcarbamoyladenylate synthase [Bacteroidota bacterium]|jgi:L-threonylcarbamoyladenylate synthase
MSKTITNSIDKAAALLVAGEVVAIPTETVYGLAGNLFNPSAVEKIYTLKNRPRNNPLIVHVKDLEATLPLITEFPKPLQQLAEKYWPGPLTVLLKKSKLVPDSITAGSDFVAIRVPAHPLTKQLLEQIPFPLVAPSANPFTRISPTKAEHVEQYFGDSIPCILDGGSCSVGLESTIIGMNNDTPLLYREGVLGKLLLESLIGPIEKFNPQKNTILTPGQWPRHYAPLTKTILCKREEIMLHVKDNTGIIVYKEPLLSVNTNQQHILSETGSLVEAAKNLYQILHHVDKQKYETIICEMLPQEELGNTINDRLKRASSSEIDNIPQ